MPLLTVFRSSRLAIAAVLAVAACREPSALDERPSATREVGPSVEVPVAVTARVELGGDAGRSSVLRGVAVLRNPASTAVTVSVAGCDPSLRAWPAASLDGAPVLTLPYPGSTCTEGARSITLPSGASHELELAYTGGVVLGDLADGAYRFTATVRINGHAIDLDAGTLDVRSGLAGVAMTATSAIVDTAPTRLYARATLLNTSTAPVQLEYSVCNLEVWAYSTAARTGTPAWKSEYRRPPASTGIGGYGCPLPLYITQLAAGASTYLPFQLSVPTYEILADSLPEGRYYLVARVHVNWRTTSIPAGEVDLRRAQLPLPAARTLGGVTFRASSRVVSTGAGVSDSVEFSLAIANASGQPHTLGGDGSVGGCRVNIAGYRDAARRDAYYLYRNGEWTAPSCPFAIPSTTLAPGASLTLRGNVARGSGPLSYAMFAWLTIDGQPYRPDLAAGTTR